MNKNFPTFKFNKLNWKSISSRRERELTKPSVNEKGPTFSPGNQGEPLNFSMFLFLLSKMKKIRLFIL